MAIIKPNNNTISAITALPAAISTGAFSQFKIRKETTHIEMESTSYTEATNHYVEITPSTSSKKIYLDFSVAVGLRGIDYDSSIQIQIWRQINSGTKTVIYTSGSTSHYIYVNNTTLVDRKNAIFQYQDSPSTTNIIKYGFNFRQPFDSSRPIHVSDNNVESTYLAYETD